MAAPPIGLSTVMSNMEDLEFLSSFIHAFRWYCIVLAKSQKQQCDKYYNGVQNSKMSDVKNNDIVYSNFQTYNPKWLQMLD